MGFSENNFLSIFRRGLYRFAEIEVLTKVSDVFGVTDNINMIITEHLAFTIAITMVGSGIYDMFDIAMRPDCARPLEAPCIDVPPLLNEGSKE